MRTALRFLSPILLLPGLVSAVEAQEPAIDLAVAREAFEDARRAGEADAGRLWGVDLYGPVYVVEPSSRFVVADRPAPEGGLEEREGVWVGTLPESINPANSAAEWGGTRWTMLVWPTPSLPHASNTLFLHEMFHRVQADVGLPANNPTNAHLDTRDARIWLRLEMRALARALVEEGDARRTAIGDALAFRALRRELYPDAAVDEDALERNEGAAEYTGLVLSGLPEDVLADRAAVGLDARDRSESFARSFAYATGPALGVLLDESGEPWRPDLVDGARFGELLARAYRVEGNAADAESRAAAYGGDRVRREETRREERHLARVADYRARLVEGPVLRLSPDAEFSFSFDPNGAVTLEGLGTVYDSSRVTDVWGVLEVESGGVLFLRNDQGWITGVVVPAVGAADPPTAMEGWTIDLAEGWIVASGDRAGDWVVRKAAAGGS